ncbi:hypothetical protein GCM10008986_16940 [Salinibacillus aidingensis]|uniref:Actin-like protein N-terminal domain-containing protein n=1 Tax=Salinibacillus aidingensis TaxID=237684 RepID=A0ABN1B7R4_9BACI
MILGIDAGNHRVKASGPFGVRSFYSNICDWFEREVDEQFGADDMEFEYEGRKGFAGSIAMYEDEFGGGNMMGDTKAHEDAIIRILLAVHRYCPNYEDIYLVTGQPIKKHKEQEKRFIKEALLGSRKITVNHEVKQFNIQGVEVAPEGSAAIWAKPTNGLVRVLDVGSGTVNAATLQDMRHINTQSDTFHFGVETVRNKDYGAMARGIIKNLSKKWNRDDVVYIVGGIAKLIAPFIQRYFPNAVVLQPEIQKANRLTLVEPVFSNAVAFNELAIRKFSA